MRRRHFATAAMLMTLPPVWASARAAAGTTVLELFTSQGCSSCPPADALLGELARRPGTICLSWHVDYWNRLGWRDPFAQAAWTERQRTYARALGEEVYTPALVVNGAAMVVGSDRAQVEKAISGAKAAPVALGLERGASGLVAAIGSLTGRPSGLLVFYDPEQTTRVGAGENHGRRLVEYRVARQAIPVEVSAGRLALPPVPDNSGAALLIRDATGRIVAAADLPPTNRS